MPGRRVGAQVGRNAFALAEQLFTGGEANGALEQDQEVVHIRIYPNPQSRGDVLSVRFNRPLLEERVEVSLYSVLGQRVYSQSMDTRRPEVRLRSGLGSGLYVMRVRGETWQASHRVIFIE